MTRSRLLLPLAAALAVLVVLGGVWWASSGSGDPDEAAPGAGAPAAPPSDGGASGDPGDPGAVEPVPTPPDLPMPSTPAAVGVDSYFPRSDYVVALNYAIGIPECYGKLGAPVVREKAGAVVVTLERIVPKQSGDVACIEIALMKSIDIRLDSPLGDRVVRDGSYGGKSVPKADAPYDNADH